jgi:NADPH-dependent curcumin reductase CurA
VKKGEIVRAPAIGEVIATKSSKWKEGQRVTASIGWQEYAVRNESEITGEAA